MDPRESYLVANSIVNAVLAADCLYCSDVDGNEPLPIADPAFRESLDKQIRSKVSNVQIENLYSILDRLLKS